MTTNTGKIADDLEKYRMELVEDAIELCIFRDERLSRLEHFHEVRSPAPVPYWIVRELFIGQRIVVLQGYLSQIQKRHRRLAVQERRAGLPVYIPYFKHHFHDEYVPSKEKKVEKSKEAWEDEYVPKEPKEKKKGFWKGLTEKCGKLGRKIFGKSGNERKQ